MEQVVLVLIPNQFEWRDSVAEPGSTGKIMNEITLAATVRKMRNKGRIALKPLSISVTDQKRWDLNSTFFRNWTRSQETFKHSLTTVTTAMPYSAREKMNFLLNFKTGAVLQSGDAAHVDDPRKGRVLSTFYRAPSWEMASG
ncbi:hypothetical protein BDW75DRAFT_243210 [Aspergillus navahoensis]